MKNIAVFIVIGFLGWSLLLAQSDSQTLHSPHSALVAIADFDFGLSMNSGKHYPLSLGGNFVAAYQINRQVSIGLGVGLHGYGPSDMQLLPLFVDGRLHFPQKKWTPFLAADLGYALSLRPSEKGGLLFNPFIGGRFPASDNLALSAAIGIRVQPNQRLENGGFVNYGANYLSLKLGLALKMPRLSRRVFAKTISRRMRDKSKTGQ